MSATQSAQRCVIKLTIKRHNLSSTASTTQVPRLLTQACTNGTAQDEPKRTPTARSTCRTPARANNQPILTAKLGTTQPLPKHTIAYQHPGRLGVHTDSLRRAHLQHTAHAERLPEPKTVLAAPAGAIPPAVPAKAVAAAAAAAILTVSAAAAVARRAPALAPRLADRQAVRRRDRAARASRAGCPACVLHLIRSWRC